MQESILKLKEIIWEITGACLNKCSYCGSKEGWNEPVLEEGIIKIAQEIAKYPPEQIDISGGDPLLVGLETHKKVTKILTDAGVLCKILVNPKSINRMNPDAVHSILENYKYIGLSINTIEELKMMWNIGSKTYSFKNKTTVITNFNIQNVFMFDDIWDYVKANNCAWQIQMTVYNNQNDSDALYNNDKAFDYLNVKINDAMDEGKANIYICDNMNNGACGAGRVSIGILSNGDIVPCLSMRSWIKNIKEVCQGNILGLSDCTSLKGLRHIWENEFQDYRFRGFKCCKDQCKSKCFVRDDEHVRPAIVIKPNEEMFKYPEMPKQLNVVYYGVIPNDNTFAYAVRPVDRGVFTMYAVRPADYKIDDTNYTTFNDTNPPKAT